MGSNNRLTALDCEAYSSYFIVYITRSEFGSDGLEANEDFKLQVGSLNNPRGIGQEVYF